MNKKINFKNFLPYIIILVLSLFATFIVFYKGISKGDDYNFHMANVIDLYETLKTSYKLSGINGILAGGFGVGTRLFYSPIAHFIIAYLARFNDLFKLDIIVAFKEFIVLSVFVSGIFMYRFALKITNNHKTSSLIGAAVYILYPYRLFDLFCRFAIAEAVSFVFIPLFFMGLYDISHQKDKINTSSFVEIIVGGSLLYLSHNLTAFYCYIAGIIYLLCNIKGIIKGIKIDKKYIVYCIASAFLLFGISSLYLFNQLEIINSNLYNLTNRVRMWTDVDSVIKRTGEELSYSGFLNISFLTNKFSNIFTTSSLVVGIILFLCGCGFYIMVDNLLKDRKHFKYLHTLISSISLFLIISLSSRRLELYLASMIFIILYNIVIYFIKLDDNTCNDNLLKDVNFWFCLVMSIISLVLMEEKNIWKIIPSIFLNIQFPWRLWCFVQFYVSILLTIVVYKVKAKKVLAIISCVLIGLLMASNQPLVEKRIRLESNDTSYVYYQTDYDILKLGSTIGWNREYCPRVFYETDYKSEYTNSLYRIIKNRIQNGFNGISSNYSINPVVLKGKANIEVIDAFSPYYQMNIEVSEDAIIQMPLIYYSGYEFTITVSDSNYSYVITPKNIDGLVSFELSKGSYVVSSKYKGTTLMNIGKILFVSCSITTLLISVYPLIKKKKKEA